MIVFIVYTFIILFWIYRNGFFGVLKDDVLNAKFFLSAFIVKLCGLAAFYFVYMKLYGRVDYSDTAHYFHDSKVIQSVAYWDFSEFLKLMFGLQDDSADTELFRKFLKYTSVWDEDREELLYNDNRLMLRFNALIHFISFNSYYVHALISCLLSFIGITYIYKTFKYLFKGKEIYLMAVWLLFPGLWFWSAGLFKEGPALFCMGMLLFYLKKVIGEKEYNIFNFVKLGILIVLSLSFKQYVTIPLLVFSLVYFLVYYKLPTLKHKSLMYIGILIVLGGAGSFVLKNSFSKSVPEVLAERQRLFLDMSNGGIFLLDSVKFVRLPYDTNLIVRTRYVDSQEKYATMKSGAKYMYWEHTHQQDTLYCSNNTDTVTEYREYYTVPKANATLPVKQLEGTYLSLIKATPLLLYYTIGKPFFFDARNMMDLMASGENLLIALALLILIVGAYRNRGNGSSLVYFLGMLFFILIVIGITSPNIGAIQRYRVLVIPFLFMCALQAANVKDVFLLNKIFKRMDNLSR